MTPPLPLPIDWWQLRKLHNRTLSETPMTTPHLAKASTFDCLTMNLTRAVQYQGCVWIGGPYPSRGTPPQSRHVPPIQNFLVPS